MQATFQTTLVSSAGPPKGIGRCHLAPEHPTVPHHSPCNNDSVAMTVRSRFERQLELALTWAMGCFLDNALSTSRPGQEVNICHGKRRASRVMLKKMACENSS